MKEDKKNKKAKSPGRFKRWIKILLVLTLLLVVGIRIALVFALPGILDDAAQKYDLRCAYDRLDLSLILGDLELWNLKIQQEKDLLNLEYCRADLSMWDLLFGNVVIRRLEADGVDLYVERDKNGDFTALKAFEKEPEAEEETEPEESSPILAPLAFEINAMRLQHVHARYVDESLPEPIDTLVNLNLRVSNIGDPERKIRYEVSLACEDILETLHIHGQAEYKDYKTDAEFKLSIFGFHPKALSQILEPMGISPAAEALSFNLDAKISAKALAPTHEALQADLLINDMLCKADGKPAFSLKNITFQAQELAPDRAFISKVLVSHGEFFVQKTQGGDLSLLGLELKKTPPKPEEPPEEPPSPFDLRLDNLTLSDLNLCFLDQQAVPPVELDVDLEELKISQVAPNQDKPLDLDLLVSVPGVMRRFAIQGQVSPFTPTKNINLQISGDGLNPVALKPYLEEAGIEAQLNNASFTAAMEAKLKQQESGAITDGEFSINQVVLRDADELFRLDKVSVSGFGMDPETQKIVVDAVETGGIRCAVEQNAEGELQLLGLVLKNKAAQPKTPITEEKTQAAPMAFEVKRFALGDTQLKFKTPDADLEIQDAGILVQDVKVSDQETSGGFDAWVKIPQLVDQVAITGAVRTQDRTISGDLQILGQGLSFDAVAPLLESSGVSPMIKNGSFQVKMNGTLLNEKEKMRASIKVEDLYLKDGENPLFELGRLEVKDAEVLDQSLDLELISVSGVRLKSGRDSENNIHFAGFALQETKKQAPSTKAAPSSTPFDAVLNRFELMDSKIFWQDQSVTPQIDTHIFSKIRVDKIHYGQQGLDPITLNMEFSLKDAFKSLTLSGRAGAKERIFADLELRARDVTPGGLLPYLPPGFKPLPQSRDFSVDIQAEVFDLSQGGRAGKVALKGMALKNSGEPSPMFSLDNLSVDLSRFDAEEKIIHISQVLLEGLCLDVDKTETGDTQVLGFLINQPKEEIPIKHPPKIIDKEVELSIKRFQESLPLVKLDKLDLNVERVTIREKNKPDLQLADLRVKSKAPMQFLGEEPETGPKAEIGISGALSPVVKEFALKIMAQPFAPAPEVNLKLNVEGIDGKALENLVPGLEEKAECASITDGRFGFDLNLALNISKRNPLDFDLSRGFGCDLSLKDLEFSNQSDLLAGIKEVMVHADRIDPNTREMRFSLVEIIKPTGALTKEDGFMEALGLKLKTPPPQEPPIEPATQEVVKDEAPPKIRVDRFYLSGMDFTFLDKTVSPEVLLPLREMDLELRNFTTQALIEHFPIQFNLYLYADKVTLPEKKESHALLSLLSDTVSLVSGQDEAPREDRLLFNEITTSGKLFLYPNLSGRVKAEISSMELGAAKGLAKKSSVDLDQGILDAKVTLDFDEQGALDTKAKISFTDLMLSEGDEGVISKFLSLPAPLGTVIFLLRDEYGTIDIPISFHMPADGVSLTAVTQEAVTIFGKLVADAVASSPFRIIGTVGDLVPIGGDEEEEVSDTLVELGFEPGDVYLSQSDRLLLAPVLEQVEDNENLKISLTHFFGKKDITSAEVRSNPDLQDCRDLTIRLRNKKQKLISLRQEIIAQGRAQMIAGLDQKVKETLKRIQAIDRELGLTEAALDQVLELMRPGAESQAQRRTRQTCINLGVMRLDRVKALLVQMGAEIPNIQDRIRILRPRFNDPKDQENSKIVLSITGKK